MGQSTINDFHTDLEYSLEEGEDTMFDNFYFRIFPHLIKIDKVIDEDLQKQGVDKQLLFSSGKIIYIDEKKRREVYPDILLEEFSNYENKTPGWLNKKKITDYIVYAFMPTKKVYLLPFLLLQKIWLNNYFSLLTRFGRKFGKTKDKKTGIILYRTSNIPIPTDYLLNLLKKEIENELIGEVA